MMDKSMYDRLVTTENRFKEVEELLLKEEVLNDVNRFRDLSIEHSELEPIVEKFKAYCYALKNHDDAVIMADDKDPEISTMGKEELKKNQEIMDQITEELKVMLLPKDPNDGKDVIFEMTGAVGGDEANIFAGDLFRMYSHYCDKEGWKLTVVDTGEGAAGGFSYIQFIVSGRNAYSRLKYEGGVHRVQRVPKTEANGRIHTSTATVVVMPKVELGKVEIRNEDCKVDTYRSSGAGGQNVNKTESAVRVTHIPTGIVVSCQTEKAQLQNKEICMQMIRAKVQDFYQSKQDQARDSERKLKVGTGERSEKIRTYNYPQNRVTDHRIGFTTNTLDRVMEGDLEPIIEALIHYDQEQKILEEEHADHR